MKAKERMSKESADLLGPKNHSKWLEWRATRDKRIASPRRLKTVEDKRSTDDSTGDHSV